MEEDGEEEDKEQRRRGGRGGLTVAGGRRGGVKQGGFCFLFHFLPLPDNSPTPTRPPSNEPSVSHILNLTSKHRRVIGAVSQSNVSSAHTDTERTRRQRRGGGGGVCVLGGIYYIL